MRQGRRLISPRIPRVERFLHGIAQSYSKFGPRSLVNHEAEEFTVSIEESVTASSLLWPSFLAFLISKNVVWNCPEKSEKRKEQMERRKKKKKKNKKMSRFRNFTRILFLKERKRMVCLKSFEILCLSLCPSFVFFEQW